MCGGRVHLAKSKWGALRCDAVPVPYNVIASGDGRHMSSTKFDENSPWQVAMRKQRRQMWGIIAGTVALLVAVAIYSWFTMQRGNLQWFGAVIALMLVPLPLILWRVARQQRRMSALVPQHNGLVCPKCVVPLVEPNKFSTDQTKLECPKCPRRYTAEDVHHFWDMSIHDPMAAARQWMERESPTGFRQKLARHLLQWKKTPRSIVALNAIVWIGAGVGLSLATGKSVILGAFTFVHMMLLMSGMMLMGASRKTRLGDSRHCARCDYQQAPGSAASERCPECGSNWREVGGVVHGTLTRRPHLTIIGAVLFAIGVAALLSPVLLRGWQTRLLPNGPLISQVISDRGFTVDEWKELRTRTLTPAQEKRLTIGLLDKRINRAWLTLDDDNWLVAQIVAGKMPAELRDRYYREMLDLELIAPASAKVGQEITLAVKGKSRGAPSTNPAAALYMGGYYINDRAEPISRLPNPIGGILLDPDKSRRSANGMNAVIVPDAPGLWRVRVEVWIVALPFSLGPPIQWQADNSPVIPPNAAWHEKRVIEHVIQVEP
jgi:hypothetical protein